MLTGVIDDSTEISRRARTGRTEVLLGGATLLNNLNETRLQLLDGGNVVGKDTHLTGGGGDVDLGPVVAKVRQSRHSREGAGGRRCFKNIHAGRAVDGLSERMQVSPRIQELGGPTGWVRRTW